MKPNLVTSRTFIASRRVFSSPGNFTTTLIRARKKPINTNILGGTVSWTKMNRPWDKRDPSPGQIGTRPWDKPAFLCLIPQSNRHFGPFVPGTVGGLSLGRLSHKSRQKSVYSQGQKHVIQLKNSGELISPHMPSQLQLGNSPELFFYFNWEMSTGRFSGISPWVVLWGVP